MANFAKVLTITWIGLPEAMAARNSAPATARESLKTSNPYDDALLAQSACNLSGLVHTLSRVVNEHIWPEAQRLGKGTAWVNQHPIVRMYLEQMVYLNIGRNIPDETDSYNRAWAICRLNASDSHLIETTGGPVNDTDRVIAGPDHEQFGPCPASNRRLFEQSAVVR